MKTAQCKYVHDHLVDVLEGAIDDALREHIVECTECRDLRHDAWESSQAVARLGGDVRLPEDFEERLLRGVADSGAAGQSDETRATHADQDRETAKDAAKGTRSDKPRTESEPKRVRRLTWAVAGALAAAVATLGLWRTASLGGRSSQAWSGEVSRVITGSAKSGLVLCLENQACEELQEHARVTPGKRLRTDAKTRAQVQLGDGTTLTLDRDSEIELLPERGRHARVVRGRMGADVAHVEGNEAIFTVPGGHVRVLGTKFDIVATEDMSRVYVTRGAIELASAGARDTVRRGEEGLLDVKTGDVSVHPGLRAEDVELEEGRVENGDRVPAGIGELKAKKPGSNGERADAVRLTRHDVTVRISDAMARTEIDETFTNTTPDELEGLYRFPVPADAQIERLALEVHGRLEEAAFVERDQAASIWRGVIHHAAPLAPKPKDEIIWVPGPWRDPALLEFKRGGRFELRVFPIPPRGSRRLVLAYTQTLPRSAGLRRYAYPLPVDSEGRPAIDQVSFDVKVVGHDEARGVRTRGYPLTAVGAGQWHLSERAFVPSGDLVVEFAPRERDAELQAWTFRAPGEGEAFVAMALRPQLPRDTEDAWSDHVLVVDTSRSMFGERLRQATRVVEASIAEMDPRDRVTVLACDVTCRRWEGGLVPVSAEARTRASQFLTSITPDGSSNLANIARSSLRELEGSESLRRKHVVYIGDGTASAGPVVPRHLAIELQGMVVADRGKTTFTAVALGQDADTRLLSAFARAGGGSVLNYASGDTAHAMGRKVALAPTGTTLRQVSVTLPDGLTQAAPSDWGALRAGGESWVVARMHRDAVDGDVIVRGELGAERFERRFPVHLVSSVHAGNAFVPRLYASVRMQELDQSGGPEAKSELIALSKRFSLASPYTSLLVLESEAMVRAFGLSRARVPTDWTGEGASSSSRSGQDLSDDEAATDEAAGISLPRTTKAMRAQLPSKKYPSTAGPYLGDPQVGSDALSGAPFGEYDARRKIDADVFGGRMIPMRRIWERHGAVHEDLGTWRRLVEAQRPALEAKAQASPDSRRALTDLLAASSSVGALDEAERWVETWIQRDALDVDAIVARADLLARRGERKEAMRVLSGIADVRSDDPSAQNRVADAYARLGDEEQACAHRVALAEQRTADVDATAQAMRCSRAVGKSDLAAALANDVAPDKGPALSKVLRDGPKSASLTGDVRLHANWSDGEDLDLALIDAQGTRISCLGGRPGISANACASLSREELAIRQLKPGAYAVEITRTRRGGPAVHGEIELTVVDKKAKVPFRLADTRTLVARVEVQLTSRLVEAWDALER